MSGLNIRLRYQGTIKGPSGKSMPEGLLCFSRLRPYRGSPNAQPRKYMKKGLLGLFILVVLFVIFWPSSPDQETRLGLIVVGAFVLILIYFLVAKTRRKPPED